MGLTQVSKDGVKNDAIDASKLPANSVGASELADNAVDTNAIADQAVALSKLPHGDGNSNGKFLRANNGADPTFETVNTDLVSDTTPQLGGHLDANTYNINISDSAGTSSGRLNIGNTQDLKIYHNGSFSLIDNDTGNLAINTASGEVQINKATSEYMARFITDGAVELYYDSVKSLSTDATGCIIQKDGSNVHAALTIKATNGGQAKLDLMTSASGVNRAARIDFHNQGAGQWTLINDYEQNGNNKFDLRHGAELAIQAEPDGSVLLYADNSERVKTTSYGVHINGYQTQYNVPAFRAGRQSSSQSVNANDTIIFNQASGSIKHFNNGNHYSTSTGRFTAPKDGVYSFWTLIIFESVSDGTNMADAFDLFVNNSQVAYSSRRAYADDGSTTQNNYFTDWIGCTLKLSANDYVYIKNKYNSKVIHNNDTYTTFQGFLV